MNSVLRFVTIPMLTLILLTSPPAADAAPDGRFDAAASICEDMIELAAGGGIPAAAEETGRLRAAVGALGDALPPATRTTVSARLSDMDKAVAAGDATALSLAAVEAYRALVEATDRRSRAVPLQVALLDYTGFKLGILARAAAVDWQAALTTADEAAALWAALAPQVHDHALSDLVDSIDGGIRDAAARRDAAALRFAAQLELDVVDLLERDFAPSP